MRAEQPQIGGGAPFRQSPIGALGDHQNNGKQRVEQLDQRGIRSERCTVDASHKLRTPLTAVRGQIEVVLRQPRTVDEYREVLERVLGQVERMSRLVNSLLLLARADTGRLPMKFDNVDLLELVDDVAGQLEPIAQEQQIHLQHQSQPDLYIVGDSNRLLQVLFNLLINTLNYTPRGGVVTLRCWREGDRVQIEVRDSGPGIAPDHLPHILSLLPCRSSA